MTTALIGLAGVVLGAVVSQGITYLVQKASDKRRFRHEYETWLRKERREAYTAFMAACDRLHGGGDQPYEGDGSLEARTEFRRRFALVRLASSSATVRDLAYELGKFVLVREPQMEEGGGSPREIDRAYGALLDKFLTAAQRDLGIVLKEPEEEDE